MDIEPNIPAQLAEQLKAGFAHQPPAEMDSYVLDVAHSFKSSIPFWRSKKLALAAAIVLLIAGYPVFHTLTYHKPTVLDAFAAARSMRDGNRRITQADVDSLLMAAVKISGKGGGS